MRWCLLATMPAAKAVAAAASADEPSVTNGCIELRSPLDSSLAATAAFQLRPLSAGC